MVWLPCNQDAGLGARGQRGQGVVNRSQKQRPVTWRHKGPMLEWGVGPGRKPRRAGTSEAEGTNSEPPAAQGREASFHCNITSPVETTTSLCSGWWWLNTSRGLSCTVLKHMRTLVSARTKTRLY